MPGERHNTEELTTYVNNQYLDDEGAEGDDKEKPVVEEAFEDVKFFLGHFASLRVRRPSEFARVDLVKQLHEDEGLERKRVHS